MSTRKTRDTIKNDFRQQQRVTNDFMQQVEQKRYTY